MLNANRPNSLLSQLKSFKFLGYFALILLSPLHAEEKTITENLNLIGIGLHQEQLNDIYVGALFTPQEQFNSKQILSVNNSKKMTLKFVTDYSTRKMTRLWKQRIAMNNPKSKWQAMTKEIKQFASIFKRSMQSGDELTIDFVPSSGTNIYLNKTFFLNIPELDFYKLLLNVWIGHIPPTESFKDGITGNYTEQEKNKLLMRYRQLQPIIGRFDSDIIDVIDADIASTNDKTIDKSDSLSAKTTKISQNTKKDDIRRQEALNDLKQIPLISIKDTKTTIQIAKISSSDVNKKNVQPTNKKDEPTNKDNSEVKGKPVKKDDSAVKSTPVNKDDPAVKSAPVKKDDPVVKNTPVKKDEPVVENTPAKKRVKKVALLDIPIELEFDEDLATGQFTKELIGIIRKRQYYPKKAISAGIEGNLTVLITIDNYGKIIEKDLLRRSGSKILDRAALRMIHKSQPFLRIPAQLNMVKFEFEVPLSFQLYQKKRNH